MRSSKGISGVLLDTSFLLPTLGIEVEGDVAGSLLGLRSSGRAIHYSRFSILEALWVVARLSRGRRLDEGRIEEGLRSVIDSGVYRPVEESAEVYADALSLHRMGHVDMIDNLLYASAKANGLRLLSLDEELRAFVERSGLEPIVMGPGEIMTR